MRRVIRDTSKYLNRLRRDDTKDAIKNVLGVVFQYNSRDIPIYSVAGTTGIAGTVPVGCTHGTSYVYLLNSTAGFSFGTCSGTCGVIEETLCAGTVGKTIYFSSTTAGFGFPNITGTTGVS